MAGLPDFDIRHFEGPFDLLDYLIQKERCPLDQIPISRIADQYLAVVYDSEGVLEDMELASSFLLMASTLLQLKSRFLLPRVEREQADEGDDPREELILRLLAYRRCKVLAKELEARSQRMGPVFLKAAERAEYLGLQPERILDAVRGESFFAAAARLQERNEQRFNRQNRRIRLLLKRERFSLRAKFQQLVERLLRDGRLFLSDLYDKIKAPRAERVTAFLALLELLRQGKCRAEQKQAFAPILIELDEGANARELLAQSRELEMEHED